VIDLDDAQALRTVDASDMLGAAAALGVDAAASYASGRATAVGRHDGVASVVVCGMGGSAVAGDVLKHGFRDRLAMPVEVNRSRALPAYAGAGTVVVVSSYSGETSKTLGAFEDAVARGCRIIAVTSGGTLAARCDELGLPTAVVPGGGQPRAALGHLAFAMLGILEAASVLPAVGEDVAATVAALGSLVPSLGPDVPVAGNLAKEIAAWIGDRVPVVWGAEGIGSLAAMRWKTQLNENGKVPSWNASMSELDHNEVVGWVEPYGRQHVVIALRHDGEDDETAARFPLSADIARGAGAEVCEITVSGGPPLQGLCELIAIGDHVSCYVGIRRGVDPTPVSAIAGLKAALAGRG
jgi:glucose/mannose-6-phosphate isomerase